MASAPPPPPPDAAAAAAPISDDAQQLAALLHALTQPNTETIRHAEQQLKPILKDARSIPALVEILNSRTQSNPVRHVAAILLRKKVGGHYPKFDGKSQGQFKAQILTILAHEPERNVRGGIVGVAATICKMDEASKSASALASAATGNGNNNHNNGALDRNTAAAAAAATGGTGWPELWQFIAAAANDPHPDARELAFWLLQEMTETMGLYLKAQFEHMATTLFLTALQDSEARVQKSAVKALGLLLSYLADEGPDVDIFLHHCMPQVLQVAANCLAAKDEDTVATVLDVLYDLAYSPSPTAAGQLPAMVQFGLACVMDRDLDMGVRDSAALVIATLAESKPKSFGKEEAMVAQVLDALFMLVEQSPESAAGALLESNPAWKEDMDLEDGDHDGMDGPTEVSMAQGTVDMLACELPKKFIFMPILQRCVKRFSSPHAGARKAGMAGLGVMAEGCSEPLREHLPDVMPHVLYAAADPDAQVRECACFALGQLSEHCQPEVLGYSSQILPVVFALLDDTTVSVQATSCYVLEMFCERLEPDAVRPVLDPLVRKLAAMLDSTQKRSVQEMAVAALAATAVAAEEEFVPYVQGVAALMTKLMSLQEERLYSLRGRALECMGHMAIAVGKQTFRPYFTGTMQCACDGLATDSTDLHEFAYAVFANLAKVMGEEFAPVLPELVPHLVKVIAADEGIVERAKEEVQNNQQFGYLDDSDDEGDDGQLVLHVRTALLEAKKGAITAIGEMAAHTGQAFVSHLEEVMEVLAAAGRDHWHPLIKAEVAEALPSMVIPSVAAYHDGEIAWQKGDVSGPNPMSQHTAAITQAVLNELLNLMKDEEKETVGKACEGVQSVIELVGPHALVMVASDCLKNTHDLLSKKAPCQQRDEETYGVLGDAYADDDDDDHDNFMNAVCDLVASFARVMGAHFKQYLKDFLPAIVAYNKSSRPASDRAMSVGCLSELAQELEANISEFWPSVFLPQIMQGLADADDSVKRNAAFCAGICCESMGDGVTRDYPQLLQGLSPLFSLETSRQAVGQDGAAAAAIANEASMAAMDNAAAAVCRMIMASPTDVPMDAVLPALLSALPLKVDMTENEVVYTCLLGLLQMSQPQLLAQRNEVQRILTEATANNSKVADEIKDKLRTALQGMN